MPKVSFYVLSSTSPQERYLFTCRLIEKAYKNGYFCYVYTHNDQQSQQLDNQLWTFKSGSFIPHQMLTHHPPSFEQSILIGTQPTPDKWQKMIVNLSLNYPENTSRCERILEILDNNTEIKQAGRTRYKQYQQTGLAVSTHTV